MDWGGDAWLGKSYADRIVTVSRPRVEVGGSGRGSVLVMGVCSAVFWNVCEYVMKEEGLKFEI